MARFSASRSSDISARETRNMERSRKIASQGMVLLKNNGALPIVETGKRIALYGNGARRTVKGGTGSGDVNSRSVTSVEQGLEAAGFTVVTKDWLDRYDEAVESARKAYFADFAVTVQKEGQKAFMQLFTNPFMEPAIIPVTEEDAGAETDTAIYVIARNSGEGKDRRPVEGEYDLFQVEKDAIHLLGEKYEKLIVVLNVGSVIDTKFLRGEEGIDAILLMSQAGNIGGYALADVVTGKVSPSGKLTTTWAENYLDYPGAEKFSHMNGDIDDEYYTEGIYVGYRYCLYNGVKTLALRRNL